MTQLMSLLNGRKTFIIAGVMILYALVIVGWQQGNWNQATELTLGALGLGALRHGMK